MVSLVNEKPTVRLPKRRHKQLGLSFSREVRTMTGYTTSIGDFFEEATARLFGGNRFTTDSHAEYCPDVQLKNRHFFEVKASGRGGKVILYERRLKRELEFCRVNNCVIEYVIWAHKCYTKDSTNEKDLLDDLASTVTHVMRVPISVMQHLSETIKPRLINRYNLDGYINGWFLKRTDILASCTKVASRKFLRVDQNLIRNFTIHHHDPSKLPGTNPYGVESARSR